MATVVAQFVAEQAFSFAVDQALGTEVGGASIDAWGKQIALGILTSSSPIPGLTLEQKVEIGFAQLEAEIADLRSDLAALKNRMENFEWNVQSLLYEAREEDLWQTMLQIEIRTDSKYDRLTVLGKSRSAMDVRRKQALQLTDDLLSGPTENDVANARLAIMGGDVNAGNERVRGFLEIWKQQALREADLGWRGERLGQIYNVLREKFLRALLIQARSARLLIEGYEARRQDDPTQPGAADYYANSFYPILVEEVMGFRDLIESLAVNLLPLPEVPLAALTVPAEIDAMLAGVDLFTAQTLNGSQKANGKASIVESPANAPSLSGFALALSGCRGRVLVPGTRWIRRKPGETLNNARVEITAPGLNAVCNGTLQIRSIEYVPYENQSGETIHKGYQLSVGGQPRDMNAMLLAHFQPTEAPANMTKPDSPGAVDFRIMDDQGAVLARASGIVVLVDADEKGTVKVPFGTFTTAFTAGSEIRKR